ncbi:MAG TPA: hypothetical protein VFE34_14005 [Dongiaceae bacterium]|jgi:hypothetical protein|nr:hypothetical protein [Dongiaceae bacterium]
MSAGLITIAYGPYKYIRMAEALALSYRRWNPKLPFCVVTDAANAERLSGYFDVVRIVDPSYGKGVAQKLCVDRYSPFDETLFVDSDCVFYRDPALAWNAYATDDFVIKGWRYLSREDQHENVGNLATLLQQTGISRIGSFNSGMFYFRKSERANRLFDTSREIYERRADLAFKPFKNAPVAHEPVLAIAMEMCGIGFSPWDPTTGMETWISMRNMQTVNVLKGDSRVTKHGKAVSPAVIHYNVDGQISLAYLRDIFRLTYEHKPLGELRARVAALWLRVWYLIQKYGRRLGGVRKFLFPPSPRLAR